MNLELSKYLPTTGPSAHHVDTSCPELTLSASRDYEQSLPQVPVPAAQQTTLPAGMAEMIADIILAKLEERDKAKKRNVALDISAATPARVQALVRRMGLGAAVIGAAPSAEVGISFDAFSWGGRSEEDHMPGVRAHIETQLRKFGVSMGRGGYKIVDVHTRRNLLDVRDKKVGVVTGGTDIAVVPFNTANFGIIKASCVLWEIKADVNVQQCADSLKRFESEAFVELIAARCLSNQSGVLVVLTDLVSGAVVLEMEYSAQYESFYVVVYDVTLDQMGVIVAQFLAHTAVPDASFRPVESHRNPRDIPAITFKKTKLSHDVLVAL